MLLKHPFLQQGNGGYLTASVVSQSGITAKDADSQVCGESRIHFADGCEKLGVDRIVPASVGGLGCGLPDIRQLGSGYVLTSNVSVQSRLLSRAREFHHDGLHFLWEVGMTNKCETQIGIRFPLVRFA